MPMVWPIGRLRVHHLNDCALVDTLVEPTRPHATRDDAHLAACAACRDRLETLCQFLDSLSAASRNDFDAAYPVERLASQRRRIMRRIERAVTQHGPGRLLRFPDLAPPTLARVRRATGWLGAAAAAGLLIGVTLGQFLRVVPGPAPEPAVPTVERAVTPATSESDAYPGDEEFLQEIELSLSTPQIWELSPLDALTPRTREVSVNVR